MQVKFQPLTAKVTSNVIKVKQAPCGKDTFEEENVLEHDITKNVCQFEVLTDSDGKL